GRASRRWSRAWSRRPTAIDTRRLSTSSKGRARSSSTARPTRSDRDPWPVSSTRRSTRSSTRGRARSASSRSGCFHAARRSGNRMASLRTWWKATQPHSFVASLVGVALGTAIAWREARTFDGLALLLTAVGVVCLHAATNMSNDSVDFRRGVDDLPPELVSPFTGGAAVRRGALGWESFLASLPLGLLVAAFLLVNEMPEHRTDPKGGKRTIPARIGLEKSVVLYEALVGSALFLLVAFSVLQWISWVAVIGLIALVPLARARAVLRAHYREYPAHIPANAGTIQAILLLGVAMTLAYLISAAANL